VLAPGQALFLPAYWWHEVTTIGQPPPALNVSVNFWFDTTPRLLRPTRPLLPSLECELARQLEYLLADALDDQAHYVPTFFRACLGTLEHMRHGDAPPEGHVDAASALRGGGHVALASLEAHRPSSVPTDKWRGLFAFVVCKLAMFVGPARILPFVHDLCHPSRFDQLALAAGK